MTTKRRLQTRRHPLSHVDPIAYNRRSNHRRALRKATRRATLHMNRLSSYICTLGAQAGVIQVRMSEFQAAVNQFYALDEKKEEL